MHTYLCSPMAPDTPPPRLECSFVYLLTGLLCLLKNQYYSTSKSSTSSDPQGGGGGGIGSSTGGRGCARPTTTTCIHLGGVINAQYEELIELCVAMTGRL